MELRVVRLDPSAIVPSRAHPGDAGLDLSAIEPAVLAPGERASVGTGIAVEIPPGHAGLVVPRSGLAARSGAGIVNAPGLIDAGYRGEIRVLLVNHDPHDKLVVERGDRIAQLVVVAVPEVLVRAVDSLGATERGADGFGSTGR